MSWKVLVTAPAMVNIGQHALELLLGAGCQPILSEQPCPRGADELRKLLPEYDALLAGTEPYPASVLASSAASRLKIIARWGVGYDSVDLSAASANGIIVTNTPGLLDEAVADYAFALLLALARQIPEGQLTVRNGHWRPSWGSDVAGKTLGLVGYGRIGLAVARRAVGFNLRLLACDPSPPAGAREPGVKFVSLDELLAESDFVSLHAALTPGSRQLLGEIQLRKMKPSALLINAARGALVDESALARALRENWIAGAALDVFCEEPLPSDHPFRTTPNLLLTPHQASFARDTGERVSLTAAQAIIDARQGRKPRFVLNPQVLESPLCRVFLHA